MFHVQRLVGINCCEKIGYGNHLTVNLFHCIIKSFLQCLLSNVYFTNSGFVRSHVIEVLIVINSSSVV